MSADNKPVPVRNARGHFEKGSTGNPGGRPRVPDELRALGPTSIQVISEILTGVTTDERISKGQAAQFVISYLVPKPSPDMSQQQQSMCEVLTAYLSGAVLPDDDDEEEEDV